MNRQALPTYQKLFICAVGLMVLYVFLSRILGIWIDPEVFNYKKILRFSIGLLFVGTVATLYILPERRKKKLEKQES